MVSSYTRYVSFSLKQRVGVENPIYGVDDNGKPLSLEMLEVDGDDVSQDFSLPNVNPAPQHTDDDVIGETGFGYRNVRRRSSVTLQPRDLDDS